VFFQSVSTWPPAAAVAFSIIVGANFASGALPLSVLFALVGCLLVAISIGQLAKHLPWAGCFYTYTARGIRPSIGSLVAWGYAFVEPLVAPGPVPGWQLVQALARAQQVKELAPNALA
jgi:amino acid transporter